MLNLLRTGVAVLVCLIPAHASAWQRGSAPTLDAPDPLKRAAAFSQLQESPGGLQQPGIPEKLLRALERENALIFETLRQSKGAHGVSDKYGEGYSEYVGALMDECFARCDRADVRTMAALVGGSYNGGSVFVKNLAAAFGSKIVPLLVEQTRSDLPEVRHQSVQALGTVVGSGVLNSTERQAVHDRVVGATRDSGDGVRLMAVRTLGEIGEANDIPLLQTIEAQDADSFINRGTTVYPVRVEAGLAIAKIQKRIAR